MANGSVFLLNTGAGVRTPQVTDPEPGSELQFTWDLEIAASEVDEGEAAPVITIRRNLNGNPHQDCTIWIEPIAPASGVQADSIDFTGGFRNQTLGIPQLIPSALAAGIDVINGPGTSVSLTFRATSANEFTFNRTTVIRDGNEGDRIFACRLFNPSLGTPSERQVEHIIRDTYVEPSGLTLNAIERPYTLCRRTAVVGETVFEVSASAGTISSITLLNDQGGRFAVGTPFAGVWPIITTLVPCDFEALTSDLPNGSTRGLSNYRPTLQVIGSGTTLEPIVKVFPTFAKMNSATIGNLTGGTSSYGATFHFVFQGWMHDSLDNRTFTVNAGVNGGILKNPMTGLILLDSRRSNNTYVGHWRTMLRTGQALIKAKGKNCKIKDLAVRCGKHMLQYGLNPDDADCLQMGDAAVPADQVTDIWVEHCSFTFGIDECTQISCNFARGPFPRRIMFMLCLFADNVWSGHSKGSHPFGPFTGPGDMEIYYIFCLFASFVQRSPLVAATNGILVQNCVMFYYANATNPTHGGISISGFSWSDDSWHEGPHKETEDFSHIYRGNLFHAFVNTGNRKSNALFTDKVWGINYINPYFGQSPYENHFVGHGLEPAHFESDPLSIANLWPHRSNVSTSIIDYDPFKLDPATNPDQYGLMPTATEQNREDLYEFVTNNAGVHERVGGVHTGAIIPGPTHQPYVDYYAVNRARQGIWNFYDYQPTTFPDETLAGYWGEEWDGVGGSIGKSMVDVGEAWTV